MHKEARLSPEEFEVALSGLEQLWQTLYVHAVTDSVIQTAAQRTIEHTLRAYDALHLAGALVFSVGEKIEFACWDRALRDAAAASGLTLVPTSL